MIKLELSNFGSLYELFSAFSFAYAGLEVFKQKVINNFSEYKVNIKFDKDINRLKDIFKNEITNSTYETNEYSNAVINKQEKELEDKLNALREIYKDLVIKKVSTYFSNSKIISLLSGLFYILLLIYAGLYSSNYFSSNINIYFYVYMSLLFLSIMLYHQSTRLTVYSYGSLYILFIFIFSLFVALPVDSIVVSYIKELSICNYIPTITIITTIGIFIVFVILIPIINMKKLSDILLIKYEEERKIIWLDYPVLISIKEMYKENITKVKTISSELENIGY
jgi:hypothetical protein